MVECYKLAGVCGVDAGPLTLRELWHMADGKRRDQWNHTAAILWAVAAYSPARDPTKPAPRPEKFNPYNRANKPAAKAGTWADLAAIAKARGNQAQRSRPAGEAQSC